MASESGACKGLFLVAFLAGRSLFRNCDGVVFVVYIGVMHSNHFRLLLSSKAQAWEASTHFLVSDIELWSGSRSLFRTGRLAEIRS